MMKFSEGLTWAAIGSGTIATLAGVKTYFSFLGSSVSIPIQFSITGRPTWFMTTPHVYLVYPLTTALLTGASYALTQATPTNKWFRYPFTFPEEQAETQHQLALNYISSISLLTSSFMLLLASRFVPQIVEGSRGALPCLFVKGYVGTLAIGTAAYFCMARVRARGGFF